MKTLRVGFFSMPHTASFIISQISHYLTLVTLRLQAILGLCFRVNRLELKGLMFRMDELPSHIKPRVARFVKNSKQMKRKDLEDIAAQYYATILMQEYFSTKVERRLGRISDQQCCQLDCTERLTCENPVSLSKNITYDPSNR